MEEAVKSVSNLCFFVSKIFLQVEEKKDAKKDVALHSAIEAGELFFCHSDIWLVAVVCFCSLSAARVAEG